MLPETSRPLQINTYIDTEQGGYKKKKTAEIKKWNPEK